MRRTAPGRERAAAPSAGATRCATASPRLRLADDGGEATPRRRSDLRAGESAGARPGHHHCRMLRVARAGPPGPRRGARAGWRSTELAALEGYERRALSRRRRAIGALAGTASYRTTTQRGVWQNEPNVPESVRANSVLYPPLEGEGRRGIEQRECEPGWGERSRRTPPNTRFARRSRSVRIGVLGAKNGGLKPPMPPPPGEGDGARGPIHSSRLAICAPSASASNLAHTMLGWISSSRRRSRSRSRRRRSRSRVRPRWRSARCARRRARDARPAWSNAR